MRKIKEILRLKWGLGLSARQVAASLRISHSTVGEYLKRAEQAGMDWAQVESMSEAAIAERLFPPQKANRRRAEPDWALIPQVRHLWENLPPGHQSRWSFPCRTLRRKEAAH
jgi:IS30 family transposase